MDTYDLIDYADMIADRVRMDAYALALKAVVKPESVIWALDRSKYQS